MSSDLPIPGPKLRAEAIRAAKARRDQLTASQDKDWWAATVEKLERMDKEQKEKEKRNG